MKVLGMPTCFIMGILIASSGIGKGIPIRSSVGGRHVYPMVEDIRQFVESEQTPGDCLYIVAYGSSLVAGNISPAAIDETLLQVDLCSRTYNLGVVGARLAETCYYIRSSVGLMESEGLPLPDIALIDLSLGAWNQVDLNRSAGTLRGHNWMDWRTTLRNLQLIQKYKTADPPLETVFDYTSAINIIEWPFQRVGAEFSSLVPPPSLDYLKAMLKHYLRIGEGRIRIEDNLRWHLGDEDIRNYPEDAIGTPFVATRGYVPYTENSSDKYWSDFRNPDNLEKYLDRIEEKKKEILQQKSLAEDEYYALPPESWDTGYIVEIQNFLDKKGILPVFIILPTERATIFAYDWYRQGVIPSLWAYDNPDQFWDEFYEPQKRYNAGHAGNKASDLLSRMIGRRIGKELLAESLSPS